MEQCSWILQHRQQKDIVQKVVYCVQINVPQQQKVLVETHPNGKYRFTKKAFEYARPLLEHVPFITEVQVKQEVDDSYINLDRFRDQAILNLRYTDIRQCYYHSWDIGCGLPKREFWKPIISDMKLLPEFFGKVVISYTKRYNNPFVTMESIRMNMSVDKDGKCDDIIFVGLQEQCEYFNRKYKFNLKCITPKDAYHAAQIFKSAKLHIGNLSGNYSISQIVKANRILIPQHMSRVGTNKNGKGEYIFSVSNVFPLGGNCSMAINQSFLNNQIQMAL